MILLWDCQMINKQNWNFCKNKSDSTLMVKTWSKNQKKTINDSYKKCWTDQLKQWEMVREQWFHGTLCLWDPIYKGNLMVFVFWIYLWFIILNNCGYAYLWSTKPNWFATHIQQINFIPQFILEIKNFRQSCDLIGRKHLGQ